jgi:hypothetical protein
MVKIFFKQSLIALFISSQYARQLRRLSSQHPSLASSKALYLSTWRVDL